MRLLHIADVHLGHSFTSLGPQLGRERRSELGATLRRVIDVARENRVDALCIAGDLFERENATPSVGELLRLTFADLQDVPVLISPGNRDYLSPGCLYDQVRWSANVHIFRTSAPSSIPVGDGTVWGCAFESSDQRHSPLAGFAGPRDGLHVGLFHAYFVDGATDDGTTALNPTAIVQSGLRFAMLGHIHHAWIDEQQWFAYPGSLEPLDSDAAEPRGALLLDVSHGSLRVNRLPVAQREVISDEIDVSALRAIAELRNSAVARRSNWERYAATLRLVGSLDGELEDTYAIRSTLGALGIDVVIDAEPNLELSWLSRQNTTLGAFVRDVRASRDGSDDDKRKYWSDVLRAGIAAFRGAEMVRL